ncbi:hypothetical protein BR93DRAFT_936452 [Coniochaeta sp. PMI_546]|nr:hypothetical protein BR93DRAFT_936452 [Coniochaeta sp. PMI_546]
MASPDLSIFTPPTSLADEEQPPPTSQFTNIKELYRVISQVSGDFLIVQNVPFAVFREISRQERRGFRRLSSRDGKKNFRLVLALQRLEGQQLLPPFNLNYDRLSPSHGIELPIPTMSLEAHWNSRSSSSSYEIQVLQKEILS